MLCQLTAVTCMDPVYGTCMDTELHSAIKLGTPLSDLYETYHKEHSHMAGGEPSELWTAFCQGEDPGQFCGFPH